MFIFLKNIFFLCHLLGIVISIFGIFFYWEVIILQGIVIISWYFNNNKCLITQLEDYLFDETIIDVYFNLMDNQHKYTKYIVPSYQRIIIYLLFSFGIIYYLIF